MSKPNLGNPNAKGVVGNRGDTAPMHLRNVAPDYANKVASQYNAESTYHPAVNDEAFTHLKDFNDHINRLAESSTSIFAMVARGNAAAAAQAHGNKDNATAMQHVQAANDNLKSMKTDSTVLPELHGFIDRASGHAEAYLNKFTPATVRKNPTDSTVLMDPSYRSRASVDVSKDEGNAMYGGQFRGFKSPDALYQKRTFPAEQAKKAKGYVKPKKGAE